MTSYKIKGLECELCKYKFDIDFMHGGETIDLIGVVRPNNRPYIVLESLGLEGAVKNIYVATMSPTTSITIVSSFVQLSSALPKI